jgi:Mn2+/Fe2+ NRAMP family transporter
VALDGRLGGGNDRLAHYRVHRSRGDRRLYGLSRSLTLPVAAAALLIVVATGSYRRVERIAIVIGLFELAFFAVAWAAHPNLETLAKDAVDLPSMSSLP